MSASARARVHACRCSIQGPSRMLTAVSFTASAVTVWRFFPMDLGRCVRNAFEHGSDEPGWPCCLIISWRQAPDLPQGLQGHT